jgi:hypothetical protein
MNCLNNCNKQTSFARSELYSIEELERKGVLENITFSISGYGISNKDPIGLLFSNEVYLYANTVGSSISQPLEFLDGELFVSTVRDSNISVAGKQFYDSLKVIRSKNEVTIKIGESYQMIYDDKTKQMTCKYISSDKLRTREKDLEFQLAFLENEGFYFDDILFEIKREDMNLSNFDIQQQTDMLEDVKKIVTLLDLLNADDLIISNLTQQEIRDLQSLVKGIVDNEIVGGLKQDLPTAFHISIQNYNFVLLCELVNKENASYRIYDFFKKNIVIKVQDRCCREQPISQYAFLHNTDYHIITNLELDGLVKSYKNIPENSTNYEYANFAVLDLLNSYDKTNESKYLLAAKELSQWILESELSSLPYVLRYINYVQTIKRERVLNREEVKELHRLIETT